MKDFFYGILSIILINAMVIFYLVLHDMNNHEYDLSKYKNCIIVEMEYDNVFGHYICVADSTNTVSDLIRVYEITTLQYTVGDTIR